MKDLQDVFGLRDEDVEPIQEQFTADKEAEYQPQQEAQRRQQEQAKAEYENQLQRYEQEFLKAVRGEYPLSEYLRDALKSFQQSLGLKDKDVKRIEQPILAQQEAEYQKQQQEVERRRQQQQSTLKIPSKPPSETDDLRSERGVDYTKLRDLLAQGKWKEADKETLAVMLKVAGREKKGWLRTIEDIVRFPCTDLRTIDTLWVKYSKGRFGFSVQKRIWESVGGTPDPDYETYKRFGDRIKWRVNNDWLDYNSLTFSVEKAPEGHLPALFDIWVEVLTEEEDWDDIGFSLGPVPGGGLGVVSLLSRRAL